MPLAKGLLAKKYVRGHHGDPKLLHSVPGDVAGAVCHHSLWPCRALLCRITTGLTLFDGHQIRIMWLVRPHTRQPPLLRRDPSSSSCKAAAASADAPSPQYKVITLSSSAAERCIPSTHGVIDGIRQSGSESAVQDGHVFAFPDFKAVNHWSPGRPVLFRGFGRLPGRTPCWPDFRRWTPPG